LEILLIVKNSTNDYNNITYGEAIREALQIAMSADDSVICYGLGVDDPKGIFGTTLGLQDEFGKERVFDTPASENAMTGIGIGAAIYGLRPVMIHQRLDFFILAMDQLVNNAAKWHFMFGGQNYIPFTIRLIIGRGWGQGPTHSQNLQAWFAHIPGLKVVMPATAGDAKGLLMSSIFDNNPVVFLEHRWLHNLEGNVPKGDYRIEIGKAAILNVGLDITIVSMSYMTVEAIHAVDKLEKVGVSCELIDLRTIRPIDWETIVTSVKKTGNLIVLDTGTKTLSVAGEIVATIVERCWDELINSPKRIALPDNPEPTSFELSKEYYVDIEMILEGILNLLQKPDLLNLINIKKRNPHDVPGDWFKGPF
jgi:acetoin:2,6-dichlorophenolindophenol oxidoreductase subunit beta